MGTAVMEPKSAKANSNDEHKKVNCHHAAPPEECLIHCCILVNILHAIQQALQERIIGGKKALINEF
jgi:hypothetical protein